MITTSFRRGYVSNRVKKAVILAAGKGSRMMPLTKSIPKPMLPLYDKPVLQYVVDEVFQSGIEEIFLIVGHHKEVIKSHFEDDSRITFIVQDQLGGTADALLRVRNWFENEPFALLYADEVIVSSTPCILELITTFEKHHVTTLCLDKVSTDDLTMYNSVSLQESKQIHLYDVSDIIEKPKHDPPSLFTSIGRMIITPDIFSFIDALAMSKQADEELILTKALALMMKKSPVKGIRLLGKRIDLGNKEAWMKAHIDFYIQQNG